MGKLSKGDPLAWVLCLPSSFLTNLIISLNMNEYKTKTTKTEMRNPFPQNLSTFSFNVHQFPAGCYYTGNVFFD